MNRDTLTKLIEQWLDHTITEQDFVTLKHELVSNPQSTELYVDIAETHSLLAQSRSNAHAPSNVIPINEILRRQKRRTVKIASTAAAAIVLITLLSLQLFFVDRSATSLAFETSPSTIFTLTHSEQENPPTGMTLHAGSRLQIEQGSVELTFDSGVKSIVLAPADLTLHESDLLYLNTGTAWFDVPKQAIGFTVKTNELEVVDLGTQFGVYSHKHNADEVHVFKGSVAVSSKLNDEQPTVIHNGQALTVHSLGNLITIPTKPSDYLTSLPSTLPNIHWSFDTDFQASGTHPVAANIRTTRFESAKLAAGKRGQALMLDGNSSYLRSDWQGFEGNRPRTASFWVKFPDGADFSRFPACVNWGDNTQGNTKWKIMLAQNQAGSPTYLRLSWGGTWINGKTHLEPDRWHHILVTSSDKPTEKGLPSADLYIDFQAEKYNYLGFTGVPKNKGMNTETQTRNAHPLLIGRSIAPHLSKIPSFNGMIDELTIYDGYMTASDVKALQKSQK